ncbi:MAG: beta-N-acetylhexosaminidase [Flavisolibacter sp.]
MKYLLLAVSVLFMPAAFPQASIDGIIPKPVEVKKGMGTLMLNEKTTILSPVFFEKQAVYLQEQIQKQTGVRMPVNQASMTSIELVHNTINIVQPEMYELQVASNKIIIRAGSVRGLVNGIQTLLQLMPIDKTAIQIPFVTIRDYPRFAYRGMHLDVARHIFPTDYIKKYIDYLTFHKFNTFHWHLTDDQGWRIEMLTYKKLNEVGSWREATLIGHFKDQPARYDSSRYGGYYTREEIKEIIDYAAVRGITIIPEIDIPGHARAIIASYPELSTEPQTNWKVATTWGMYNRQNNVLAPKPETFTFLRTVFHEIADLFPSEYIHIGGDECSKMWWKADPATQRFMKENNIRNEAALQSYFIEQVAGYLAEKNKKIIGWHEIMEGNVSKNAIVMNWADQAKAMEAAHKGHSIIMTPGKPLYFDHYQGREPHDSLSIHGYNPVDAVYHFEPVPSALKKLKLDYLVMGAQANVWTEYIEYPTKVDYMVFPRMTALSEVLWTPSSKKNYRQFIYRLNQFMIPRYRYWNASWFPGFE